MALQQKLIQKQAQTLTLTPQLRQAIKLLELSNLELNQYLETLVEENPVLTLEEAKPDESVGEDSAEEDAFDTLDSPDYDNLWTNEAERPKGSGVYEGEETFVENPETLRDHLYQQLNATFLEGPQQLIGSQLIEGLDERGYLTVSPEEISEVLGVSLQETEEVLQALQGFDPCGVFARDLLDCLRLQLKDQGYDQEEYHAFFSHISLFVEGKIDKLLKVSQLSEENLKKILKILRTLNPNPGHLFDPPLSIALIPDVYVHFDQEEGIWRVRLNEATLPKVIVDRGYGLNFEGMKKDAGLKKYITEKYAAAEWLLKSLEQRTRTILKVSEAIVEIQKDFFEKGAAFLKPLVLREIAERTELHESTISRVTTHKYMATPRGVFELKFFFSSSVQGMHDEEDVSSSVVKQKIHQLIQKEPENKPFSDDYLVSLLAVEGVDVARRTITKYREALNIPSSFERKRQSQQRKMGS